MSSSKLFSWPSLALLILFFFNSVAFSQQLNQNLGTVSGSVKDSLSMGVLSPATIAVYTAKDTTLVKYRLNDGRGRFTLDSLPVGIDLLLIVSYVGFKSSKTAFHLPANTPVFRKDNILLSIANKMLKEVQITRPPMIMRGDTIEFSADAFKTQKNAVVGDLLKKLPGFIIWGDGKITVNGKRVSQVIVDGKVFFENDPRIVTENLPKEIVDKVQVYPDAPKTKTDSASSTLTMNVTLKEGKKSGVFGKLGGAYGSNKRFDANLMLAAYTPKDQLSIAASANNVNKENSGLTGMMLNSSFKNTAITSPFSFPNFSARGITEQKSVAALHQRNWNSKWYTKLDFANSSSDNYFNENTSLTTVLGDSSLLRTNINNNESTFKNRRITGDIRFRDSTFNFLYASLDYSETSNKFSSNSSSNTISSNGLSLNETESIFDQLNSAKNLRLNVEYRHRGAKRNQLSKEDVDVKYTFSRNYSKYDKNNQNNFFDYDDDDLSVFNRFYNENYWTSTHQFNLDYKSLGNFLGSRTSRFSINFYNEIYHQNRDMDNVVKDFDQSINANNINNSYLSNSGKRSLFIDRPSLNILQRFDKTTLGRLYKSVDFNALVKGEFAKQTNRTIKTFQDINRDYVSFLPDVSVKFIRRNIKVNRFDLSFRFNTESSIPSVDQLVPLIDSSQVLNYFLGNTDLKKNIKQNYQVNFYWNNEKTNGHTLNIQFNRGIIKNSFSDSTYYTSDGRRIVIPINMPYYYNSGRIDIAKPIKIKKNLITLEIKGDYSKSTSINFFNGDLRKLHSLGFGGNTLAGMSMNDKLGIRWSMWYKSYRLRVEAQDEISYRSYDYGSSLQLSIKVTDKMSMGHSFNINTNYRDSSNGVSAFIWNAFLSQRLGQKDQFELALNANDILDNNVGLINRIDGNTLITGTSTRLKQYFTLNFAYYPRFF